MAKIRLADSLWIRSPNSEHQLFQPITDALQAHNCRVFSLQIKTDRDSLAKLKRLAWKNDDHVIIHGLLGHEFHKIKPIFKERKNFSLLSIDWWNTPFWFTQNAEYAMFNLYGGIAARIKATRFAGNWQPPILSAPVDWVPYAIASAALRPAVLLALPYLNWRSRQLRIQDNIHPDRLIYFPIPISAKNLPFRNEKPQYDICNAGNSVGFWYIRDPYVPPKYNFVNLYSDRRRLYDLIRKLEDNPYKIFDRRRHRGLLPWETYCSSIRQSRFAMSTGGIHQASVPKFLEYACFGTPMIGASLPYEFPWLDKCLFPIDGLSVTLEELSEKLKEAFELQPKLRQNCLELRDTLLRMYDPLRIFEMAQAQIDGKPIPPGYLRKI